jgi:serine/threonine-protein kinase
MEGPVTGSATAADASATLSANAADAASASSPLGNGGAGAGAAGVGRAPKWKGRILKRFKLVDLLGQGAMGKVFRAEDVTLRRYVALKVLPTKTKEGQRDHKVDQFVREARSAATLDHPNAVTIYEIGESSGVHYIAMELVEGGNLEKLIKASGPMEIDRACQIAAEAAEALSAAHQMGIIHRDVKPSNIILLYPDKKGGTRLMDFGLAKIHGSMQLTQAGMVAGSPSYISPEVWRARPFDHRIDVYSFGAVVFRALSGRPPFSGDSMVDILMAATMGERPMLSPTRPELGPDIDLWVRRALAIEPDERYPYVSSLWNDFIRIVMNGRGPSAQRARATFSLPG